MRFSRPSLLLLFRLLAVLFLGGFIYAVFRLGPGEIWSRMRGLGWLGFGILFGLRLVYWAVRAFGWALLLKAHKAPWLPGRLLGARLAGHTVSYLTPAAKVGGEAVRVLMVGGVDRKKLLSSAVVDKTVEFSATLCCIIVAVIWVLARHAVSWQGLVLFLAVCSVLALVLIWMVRKQKRGMFAWLLRGIARLKVRFAMQESRRESAEQIDAYIADVYRDHRPVLRQVFGVYLILVLVWAAEIHLTFLLIGARSVTPEQSFLLVCLGSLSFLTPVLPASLGIYEITYVSLFVLLGIEMEAGAAVILIRRVLGLIWAGIGLVPLWGSGRSLRSKPDPSHGPSG